MISISFPFTCPTMPYEVPRQPLRQRARLSDRFHCFQSSSTNKLWPRDQATLSVACKCSAQGLGSEDDDRRALETVLKLYKAIKNKNFNELSDIIGEECLCNCNFVSTFHPFHGKEQVLGFFSSLMKNLGNNIEIVVKPTFHDGMNVGVSWKLEWGKNRVPLGKGLSFYTCHIYQGKVVINNVDMFLEPILHIEPLRLVSMVRVQFYFPVQYEWANLDVPQKTITSLTSAMDDIYSRASFQGKAKAAMKIFFSLFLVAALLYYLRHRF
ncbi:unnamed protein product [Coffea canephora]|uniref:DH200=94 genomic scaffold, scaffold_10611 n=1 Tax=Coffea canephora TaxID=49390 RepID=A0A068VQX5_COFCA|nr:unnamed protein product [Coffea canephora]